MDYTNQNRRRFLGNAATAAIGIATVPLGIAGFSQKTYANTKRLPMNNNFGPIKQITAGLLDIGYAEDGPASGPVVILLHGWPYDIHSFADVSPLLAAKGYRVIVPYLRGYGSTRFLSASTL